MIKLILLSLILAQIAQGVDVGHTGRRIILQSDVETIIITLQLDKIKRALVDLSLIHISEPTRLGMISYAVFCLKKKRD